MEIEEETIEINLDRLSLKVKEKLLKAKQERSKGKMVGFSMNTEEVMKSQPQIVREKYQKELEIKKMVIRNNR